MRKIIPRLSIALLAVISWASFAQQVCQPGKVLSAPNSRYVIQGDTSQVLDTQTRLVWQRCPVGKTWRGNACTGGASDMTWQGALSAATAASSSSGLGWRVPSIQELTSLIETACSNPSINAIIFPTLNQQGVFWSTTTGSGGSGDAWVVSFDYGNNPNYPPTNGSLGKSNGAYVRLVRGPVN